MIKQLTKDDLLYWIDRYDKEEDLDNIGLEKELRIKFQKNKYFSKDDLRKIIEWKFQGRLRGRQKRILNLINPVEDKLIRKLSKAAFKTEDDRIRLQLLSSIRGVGNALCSVILCFFDPQKYGVLDIHDWRELFGKEPSSLFADPKCAIKFFHELRRIADKSNLQCREVEKALFKKNLEESKSDFKDGNIVIKNKWTTIVREENYLIVERQPALIIIPIIRKGSAIYTYLVKQYRYPIGKEVWQFPMGTLENNADPKEHAKKELEEETGLKTNKITLAGSYYIDPGLSRQQCYVYIVEEIIEGGKQKPEETEAGMITKRFSLAELETLVADNQLTDGWIYPALYFLKHFLKQS